ncbi:hypothetical protein BDW42DRAFT_179279, partial [Aspergillus taichungensis]
LCMRPCMRFLLVIIRILCKLPDILPCLCLIYLKLVPRAGPVIRHLHACKKHENLLSWPGMLRDYL